jgi:hypothetical protein
MSIKSKSSSIVDSIFGESKTYPIDFENLQTKNTNDYLKSNSINDTTSISQNIPSLSVTSDIPKSNYNDLYKPSLTIPYSSSSSEISKPSSSSNSTGSNFSSSSISSYFFSYNLIIFFIIILLLLSFIGYNIFIFLYYGIEGFTEDFKKYVIYILNLIGYTELSQTSNNNNENQQLNNINVNTVQGGIERSTNENQKINEENEPNYLEDKQINTNLKNKDKIIANKNNDYEADDTMSNIQSKGKSGYCYIGEDRGFNSCVYVGPNDTCLSGDIFPTMDICVNPKLRT